MEEKSYLKGINCLVCGDDSFVIDKFSGFKKVYHNIQLHNYRSYKITYYFEIYFSGNSCVLSASEDIPLLDEKSKGKFFGIFKNYTNEAKFIQEGHYLDKFEKSCYKSGRSESVISDYQRWFAKQTKTEKALNKLKEKIEMAFNLIDENKNK